MSWGRSRYSKIRSNSASEGLHLHPHLQQRVVRRQQLQLQSGEPNQRAGTERGRGRTPGGGATRTTTVGEEEAGDEVGEHRHHREEQPQGHEQTLADHLLADLQLSEVTIERTEPGDLLTLATERPRQQHTRHRSRLF